MNIIQEYYENFNFPASEKLYRLLKKDGHNFKKKDIEDFLLKQKEHEMLKVKQVKKKQIGHITAFTFKENAQMDIFDISKYSKNNKNYKYLLVLIDVFTRKVFLRPLKNKNMDDVIINLIDVFTDYIPHVITSDSDSSFMSNQLQALFDKNNIYHDVVIARDDHRALGIIDRFALNIKTTLSKLFLRNNNTNWIDHISKIVDKYNKTPHSSIANLTPDEATDPIYQADLGMINSYKAKKLKVKSEFKEGDKVRVRIKETFRKGSEPRFSDKIYIVESVNGLRVTLDNDKTYLESNLIKTDLDTEEPNIINKTIKENAISKTLKKEGIDSDNIITHSRRKK